VEGWNGTPADLKQAVNVKCFKNGYKIIVFMTIFLTKITGNVSMTMPLMASESKHDHPNKKSMSGNAVLLRTRVQPALMTPDTEE
jgi:hypothetical protein